MEAVIDGAIPYGELSRYCRDEDIAGTERRLFLDLVQAMDRAWMDKMAADRKAARPARPPRGGRKGV